VVDRARIVLLAGEGMPGKQIAATVGCAEPMVATWRRRYAESGLAGLEDLPRRASRHSRPSRCGIGCWS
jgi:transposase